MSDTCGSSLSRGEDNGREEKRDQPHKHPPDTLFLVSIQVEDTQLARGVTGITPPIDTGFPVCSGRGDEERRRLYHRVIPELGSSE